MIPVFKHAVLAAEAVGCALREARSSNGVIVIVNDGCPYPETHETCGQLAEAFPERIAYIRTANAGLSAARNAGIRHALELHPSIEHLYMLDADNRLAPGAMRRAARVMVQSAADWVYPNIDKFGLEFSGDFSAAYSVLRHLFQNICEAGSLIHRRVFDRGLRFDEQMRQGYEDWEFWLQCIEAGFRGVPCPDFGFQYRARRESMVRDASRADAEIMAYIRTKHRRLYAWNHVLQLEHAESPRFCVIDLTRQRYVMTSVPGANPIDASLATLEPVFWNNWAHPAQVHFPPFVVVTSTVVSEALARLKLLDWLFWQIEDLLEQHDFVFLTWSTAGDEIAVSVKSATEGAWPRPGMVLAAAARKTLGDCALDPATVWFDSLATDAPLPRIAVIQVSAPLDAEVLAREPGDALAGLSTLMQRLKSGALHASALAAWEWRSTEALPSGDALMRSVRTLLGALGPLGATALHAAPEIAFLLPVVSFGGVEQVAIQVALAFKRAGWRTRLVVTGTTRLERPSRLEEVFDVIAFLNDPEVRRWSRSGQVYFGHDLQTWAVNGRIDRLIGLLAGSAAVINSHAMPGNEVMGWLKRQGVITINALHVVDRDRAGAPQGYPYMVLPYEHAYDLITAPSRQLLGLCNSLGIPREKLVLLENAPTFDVPTPVKEKRLQRLEHEAGADTAHRPLRVLSLGRLDRQKGLDRVAAVIRTAREHEVPIEWRAVGSRVLADAEEGEPSLAGISLEPAVFERSAVIELLLSADVLILLSLWEGSPLSILEAQSVGVIPLVTDVGAVREMITSEEDGIVVPNGSLETIVTATVVELRRLQTDPHFRLRLARRAVNRVRNLNWERTSRALLAAVAAASSMGAAGSGKATVHPGATVAAHDFLADDALQ